MSESLKVQNDVQTDVQNEDGPKKNREFLDPLHSDRGGVAGHLESFLRRFKNFVHFVLIVPLASSIVLALGLSAVPGIAIYRGLTLWASGSSFFVECFVMGVASALGYFAFGLTLLLVIPAVNLLIGRKLHPWRGPYYSLEAIRWYLHNAYTYIPRYMFLEFVTPTPFSIMFYKLMGMKIGHGSAINTTNISDPSLIEIGKKVTIGGSVTLIGHYGQGGYLVLAPLRIHDGATIGLKATLMGGVTIGPNAKILPHSIVLPKTQVPAGETWGGVPAVKLP